jgi:hypothetical protein
MLLLPNTTEFKADTEQLCNMVAMQHASTYGLEPKFLQNQCFIHAEWSKIGYFGIKISA